ncbi:MAG: hypothetical protein KDA77_19955, partial [Planctomycetaceae bacterium]|nr:hypothetical protein [Planctomycetaceae bacterium]
MGKFVVLYESPEIAEVTQNPRNAASFNKRRILRCDETLTDVGIHQLEEPGQNLLRPRIYDFF